LPDFESGRSRLPLSISAAAIQASIPCFTQMGTATVRRRPALPRRSMMTPSSFSRSRSCYELLPLIPWATGPGSGHLNLRGLKARPILPFAGCHPDCRSLSGTAVNPLRKEPMRNSTRKPNKNNSLAPENNLRQLAC
jgi:hypothetical protein